MDTAGRSRLEPAHPQSQRLQVPSQRTAGQGGIRTALIGHLSHVNPAVEVRSRGDDHGGNGILRPQRRDHAADTAVLHENLRHLCLPDFQILRLFADVLHVVVILHPIRLHPQAVNCRPFALIEHPALQEAGIGSPSHFAAQRINLPHQMPLAVPPMDGLQGMLAI